MPIYRAPDRDLIWRDKIVADPPPPTLFLLDVLTQQPLWAHALGVQLLTGQLVTCRVKNDIDEEMDVELNELGVAKVAELEAFCGSGDGALITVYNAVAESPYPQIDMRGTGAKVVVAGVAVLGENGYLAAQFDGDAEEPTNGGYSRGDALGLSGDVAITLCADGNENGSYFGLLGLGQADAYPTGPNYSMMQMAGGDIVELDYIGEAYASAWAFTPTPYPGQEIGWLQVSRDVGDSTDDAVYRFNGEILELTVPSGDTHTLDLGAGAGVFTWGAMTILDWYGSYIPLTGLGSNAFVWNAVLGAPNQTLLDAWQSDTHA